MRTCSHSFPTEWQQAFPEQSRDGGSCNVDDLRRRLGEKDGPLRSREGKQLAIFHLQFGPDDVN